MKIGAERILVGLAAVWCASAWAVEPPPAVRGRVESIKAFRVVHVWGTPREMGYAHGRLLGDEYVEYARAKRASLPRGLRNGAAEVRARMRAAVRVPDSVREELQGLFDGIVARTGSVPTIAPGQPLTLDDLILFNATDLLRAFACSGFTVWGPRAGAEGVITARNFDFEVDGARGVERQFILVRHPERGHAVATVTLPGYIGAFTGVNDDGVCVFMHDGTGPRLTTPTGGPYTPVAWALRDLLLTSGAEQALTTAGRLFRGVTPTPFSYMVRVVTPRPRGGSGVPVRVFRLDARGLSENPVGAVSSITTNHYIGSRFEPLAGAGDWSRTRYKRIKSAIATTVTPRIAWQALRATSPQAGGNGGTLHSIVVYPERRRLDLALAGWNNHGLVPASAHEPTTLEFDQLFADPRQ